MSGLMMSNLGGTVAAAELLFLFLLAAGVTAVTAAGFTAWAAYHVVRFVALSFVHVFLGGPSPKSPTVPPTHAVCPDPVCRGVNPDFARFCRQCGRMLRGPGKPS